MFNNLFAEQNELKNGLPATKDIKETPRKICWKMLGSCGWKKDSCFPLASKKEKHCFKSYFFTLFKMPKIPQRMG